MTSKPEVYLVDTSALIRLQRREADSSWDRFAARGVISVCEPVLSEAMNIAASGRYSEAERVITDVFPTVTVPEGVWELCRDFRQELGAHSTHKGVSVVDLVIAATAVRLKMTVLHEDRDFETVARFVPHLKQHRLSAGPKES